MRNLTCLYFVLTDSTALKKTRNVQDHNKNTEKYQFSEYLKKYAQFEDLLGHGF